MNTRPMPRVSAAAVMAETPRPTKAPPGTTNQRRRGRGAKSGRHGAADQADDQRAGAVALKRHLIKIAQLLDHAQVDRGDAGDIDDRQRDKTAQRGEGSVPVDDFSGEARRFAASDRDVLGVSRQGVVGRRAPRKSRARARPRRRRRRGPRAARCAASRLSSATSPRRTRGGRRAAA